MDNIKILAEKILNDAAKDSGGHYYPSQIVDDKILVEKALELLTIYGRINYNFQGATPIFTINDLGRHFVSIGAWSKKESVERLATERHNEQMEISKKNILLVKWSIVVTLIVGLITAFISICK